MSVRVAARKRAVARNQVALPGRKTANGAKGSFLLTTRKKAAAAKSFATRMVKKGQLSESQYKTVIRKANKKLGKKS